MASETFAEVGGAANVKTVFALQNVDVVHIKPEQNWMWQIVLPAYALWSYGEVKEVKADLSR